MHHYTDEELQLMDVKTLTELYSKQLGYLNLQLLEGVEWEALALCRKWLTRVGVALDMKLAQHEPNIQ